MKTKPRGLRRKCQTMVRRLITGTTVFPLFPREGDFWHLHLPVPPVFIDSKATPFSVRRLCVQTLIDRAQYLAAIAPKGKYQNRVVVAITLPDLRGSQIIVFFGEDYFSKFLYRNTAAYCWTPIEQKSLVRRWALSLPAEFSEQGYHEAIEDEDGIQNSQIWFIGN